MMSQIYNLSPNSSLNVESVLGLTVQGRTSAVAPSYAPKFCIKSIEKDIPPSENILFNLRLYMNTKN